MRIVLNGSSTEVPEGMTVAALLQRVHAPREGVAVEINREIVPRGCHAEHPLHAGDTVEIVAFVGGG